MSVMWVLLCWLVVFGMTTAAQAGNLAMIEGHSLAKSTEAKMNELRLQIDKIRLIRAKYARELARIGREAEGVSTVSNEDIVVARLRLKRVEEELEKSSYSELIEVELAKILERQEEEKLKLSEQLAKYRSGISPERSMRGRKRVVMEIVGGRVLKPSPPFYRVVETGYINTDEGNRVPAERLKRVDSGQLLEGAFGEGGLVAERIALAKKNGDELYFFLYVAPDSIPEYRRFVERLRESEFPHVWSPAPDSEYRLMISIDGDVNDFGKN